jgi:hypothetical protein
VRDDDPARLDIHVEELRQMFNAMDPAPFHRRELDPKAEAFILEWAREAPGAGALAMDVHVDEALMPGDEAMLREAVHQHFAQHARSTRRSLRGLFRTGRVTLVIGLAFLVGVVLIADQIASRLARESHQLVVMEAAFIGGWVALWRPIEIFLYDWWPLRGEARLADRLGAMEVRVTGGASARGAAA